MPKLSKSQRKKLKAQEERKSNLKHGEPFSKHKEYICYHYDTGFHLLFHSEYYSLITEKDNEYVYSKCKCKFTKEQYELMNEYIKNKDRLSDCYYGDKNALPDGIQPTKYYYSAPNQMVWITEDN